MRLLWAAAVALGCAAGALFAAGVWLPSFWPGVAVAVLFAGAVLAFAWLEHVAAQRRVVVLEDYEARLKHLESVANDLNQQVIALNRERALNRM